MAQARIFYQQDCDINVLKGKRVAIIGYGSQGHAHALNLKESGVDVVVGLYEGSKSWAKAEQQGLTVMTTEEAAKTSDIIMILIPDEKQAALYKSHTSQRVRLLHSHTALTFTLAASYHQRMSMLS